MSNLVRMNDFFNDFWFTDFFDRQEPPMTWSIVRANDSVDYRLVIPGVPKEDISISLEDDQLTVIYKDGGKDYRVSHSVLRGLDTTTASASLENGILKVTFERHKPKIRKIEIK